MLRKWLESGLRFRTLLLLLPALTLFCMGAGHGGQWLVEFFAPDLEVSGRVTKYNIVLQTKGILEMAPRSFVWVPIKEEFFYRLVPFGVLWSLWSFLFLAKPPVWITAVLIVATSIVFGYIHGGVGNIFIQGVIGAILAVVLLKVSSYGAMPLKGAAAAILLHGTHNFGVALSVQYQLSVA